MPLDRWPFVRFAQMIVVLVGVAVTGGAIAGWVAHVFATGRAW